MERGQIWVVGKYAYASASEGINPSTKVSRAETGWGGWVEDESRHILRVIILHDAACESPRFPAWGVLVMKLSTDMQCCWFAEWTVSVRNIYLLSLYYEMGKDSCCLPSCESFIGPQLGMGQTLGSSGRWHIELGWASVGLPGCKPGRLIHQLK